MNTSPIGIFDSGVGGLTVLKTLMEMLPDENFVYCADSKNAPYGEKTVKEIFELTRKNVEFLLSKNCKLIVIACNTATGVAIDNLRKDYTNILFVGLEPAIKPACLKTKTRNIGVLATEGTFKGRHFNETSKKYIEYVNIHTQAGYKLAEKVENNSYLDSEAKILLDKYLSPMLNKNIDYLVLGCTHYPFYLDAIQEITKNNINVIDSGDAIARRVKYILMTHKLVNSIDNNTNIQFYTSGSKTILEQLIFSYLHLNSNTFSIK